MNLWHLIQLWLDDLAPLSVIAVMAIVCVVLGSIAAYVLDRYEERRQRTDADTSSYVDPATPRQAVAPPTLLRMVPGPRPTRRAEFISRRPVELASLDRSRQEFTERSGYQGTTITLSDPVKRT